MKLRYMIEYALRDRIRKPLYKTVGVWVQGPGTGIDLVVEFLPGNAEAARKPTGSSIAWWKTTSEHCPRISWPTTNQRFPLIAVCAARFIPTRVGYTKYEVFKREKTTLGTWRANHIDQARTA